MLKIVIELKILLKSVKLLLLVVAVVVITEGFVEAIQI